MRQAPGESPSQRPSPRTLPRDLADKAYALVPLCGNFVARLEQQEATITYLSLWLGDGHPTTFYSPPERYVPGGVRINCSIGECTGLPWIVDRFYVRGLDRNYCENRNIRRALNEINSRTRYLDDHPDVNNHPDDAQAPDPAAGPSA
jgi:hypothetical protein